jgi:subtilisin family serine protease
MNGTATRLTEAEAEILRSHPMVRSVNVEEIHQLSTDVGPEWIGAAAIWDGTSGFSANEGEGMVVGIIDSGIAWDHDSFADPAPSPDFHNHVNPFGEQIGLCSDAEVLCNDKLIGVWDFTDEESKGKDTSGHGSNVASIAVGNRHTVSLDIGSGVESFRLKGVAPHANLVSYKVCREDDPETPDEDEDGCPTTGIVQAINQAITDGVDVVNFSIGSGPANPWSGYAMLFLELRDAGIFAATSNGNDGPLSGTTGYPAVAPWLPGIGAATHSRVIGARLTGLTGGDLTPPDDFIGGGTAPVNGSVNGYGPAEIVFAGDFGNALCGQGTPELQSTCNAHTGSTNPFPPGTFNGEIVVCERGNYGRIEKSFNVMEAGAGGYILTNSLQDGNVINRDSYCIPGIHLSYGDGVELKSWLASGDNHVGRIGRFDMYYDDIFGDQMGEFSGRGPNAGVDDVLKPNVIAPGINIIGASDNAGSYWLPSGTSMASPHVAGAAALLLGVHSDWSVSDVASALETTAIATLVKDIDGSDATPHVRGSGRVALGDAANAGLSLEISTAEFTAANPLSGGVPKDLNLVGLVDSDCFASCSFTRTVTDLMGGGSWTVSTEGFPAGVDVTVTPSSFSLANGASRSLDIDLDLTDAPSKVGGWVYGNIVLSASGAPDARLTAAVFSAGGDLPNDWVINSSDDAGFDELVISGTVGMSDATYTAGGLIAPTLTTETIAQDPTDDEVYDGPAGIMTVWLTVPEDGLWLHTETLASTATDLDLYVGRDVDGDGLAEESEELCSSTTPDDLELSVESGSR